MSSKLGVAALISLVAVMSVLGTAAIRSSAGSDPGLPEMPRSAEIEADYGIRVERVSLIGGGGLVEMRYVLLDAGKAGVLHEEEFDFADDFPHIIAGDTVIDEPTFHHHGGDLVTGRQLSILYGNLDGAVKPGGTISIQIGSDQLDGVPVG